LTRARFEAVGGIENYIRQMDVSARLKWKGDVPQFMLGGAGANAPTMPIIVPLTPASSTAAAAPK
jgi:hypothetical protein